MARINWKSVEREEQAIEEDETMTQAEKNKAMRDLQRDIREDYREQQERERSEEFGW